MATNKHTDKGFCPFCGMGFVGDHDYCPFCGQDLRQYKDDLGPVMEKIQTATNIDMKSPKVRITMSIVIFLLVFAGALVAFDYFDPNKPAEPVNPDVPDTPVDPVPPDDDETEGIRVEVKGNGYMDLTGDFKQYLLKANPVFDPDLKLVISLGDGLERKYYKVMWEVNTESYNPDYTKNPFYIKVTKERSDSASIGTVTWDGITVGKFYVIASCYTEGGECDIYEGYGTYYGKYTTEFNWTYKGSPYTLEFTMSSDEVRKCLDTDLRDRLDQQDRSSMKDYVADTMSITGLSTKLRTLYNMNYKFSDFGFCEFVLCFVQSCIPNVHDSYNYHTADYWAYPYETLLWGCGDDEDRAILYCSILKCGGYSMGLLHLPDTVIAGVDLDLDPTLADSVKAVRLVNVLYTVADTSSDLPLGEMRPEYDVSKDGRTLYHNDVAIHGRYGMEAVRSRRRYLIFYTDGSDHGTRHSETQGGVQAGRRSQERPQDGQGQDSRPGGPCGRGMRPVRREEEQEGVRRLVRIRPGQDSPQGRLHGGAGRVQEDRQQLRDPYRHDHRCRQDADRPRHHHVHGPGPCACKRARQGHRRAQDAVITPF
jgi:hypothetical protein